MSKLTLSDLSNLQNETSAVATLNTNNTLTELALENTLSLDGTSPNSMLADLDMNSNQILNLPTPTTGSEPITLNYLETALADIVDGGFAFASITAASPATGDYLLFGDISDNSANKKATISTVLALASAGSGDVTAASTFGTDNRVIRSDGVSKGVQSTGITVDDSNNVTGVVGLTATTLTTTGNIELGNASDTTLSRSSAGILAVEGVTVPLNSTSSVHTASTIELGNASDTTLSRASAGVLAVEGINVLTTGTGAAQGKQTIYIPAAAMKTRTTNGAAAGSVEQATNKNMVVSLDFDTTTQQFAQFNVWFPKSWNLGTVTFQPSFSQLTTAAGGVVFGLAGVAKSDGDALDVAFGTAQTSTKIAGTANLEYQGPESAAITIAGSPAAGDRVEFQINRTVADASDTLAQNARLHGVRLFFTTNASTDT